LTKIRVIFKLRNQNTQPKFQVLPEMRVSVLMGANLAPEVAAGMFCETTIGCTDPVSLRDLVMASQ
jgi:glycerol-3-phosphate dehydrogenase